MHNTPTHRAKAAANLLPELKIMQHDELNLISAKTNKQTLYEKGTIMNIRQTLSSAFVAIALFATAQTAVAQDVKFYQKASEAVSPITGNVAMRLTIMPDGNTENVRITRTSGSKSVDAAAVAWMEAQTMRPVKINGTPREFSIVKEINFSDVDTLKLGMK